MGGRHGSDILSNPTRLEAYLLQHSLVVGQLCLKDTAVTHLALSLAVEAVLVHLVILSFGSYTLAWGTDIYG